jgi:DNA-binding transcriptional MerR regulator/methylmalonyl-CoA mutase cobalamin-binding subunit
VARGKYTVNEVEERTKVPGSTLRQWERRYGFPKPERSDAGYRLYSDQDLGHIDAMKRHIAEGIPASRAAELVRGVLPLATGPRPPEALQEDLVAALVGLDEESAERVLSEAHALHSVEEVMFRVISGTLTRLGELWQQGALTGAIVGFGSSYLQGRLRGLLDVAATLRSAPAVLVACAPGNRHEFGPLMLAVALRRSGFRVYYLGADVQVAELAALAARLRPVAVLVSAALSESLEELEAESESLRDIAPILGFGGAAFNRAQKAATALGGHFLGRDVAEGVDRFRQRLRSLEAA